VERVVPVGIFLNEFCDVAKVAVPSIGRFSESGDYPYKHDHKTIELVKEISNLEHLKLHNQH
jgi:hypothetical protein